MSAQLFSIPNEVWRDFAPGRPLTSPKSAGASERLSARWETLAGVGLGDEIPMELERESWIEYPDGDGGFGHASETPAVTFTSDPPKGAAILRLYRGDAIVARVAAEQLRVAKSALPAPARLRIGRGDARLVIPVFSERFPTQAPFLASVRELHAWILAQPPFVEPAIGDMFAFDACFWPSDPAVGLFATPDQASQQERLFHGDRALAKRLLDPFIGTAATSLVLINSQARGGAGGNEAIRPGHPSRHAPMNPGRLYASMSLVTALGSRTNMWMIVAAVKLRAKSPTFLVAPSPPRRRGDR